MVMVVMVTMVMVSMVMVVVVVVHYRAQMTTSSIAAATNHLTTQKKSIFRNTSKFDDPLPNHQQLQPSLHVHLVN